MHLKLDSMSLAEWAAMDAQWFYEAYDAQQAYRQGQHARNQADHGKAAM